ncbi:uncharacterized protein LTR77_001044 [Saxophila tyrrhenica]|uniref:SGNH hydrolase-type esterase domain-containing protein n=1 Tax=Saxophila tyrrhenica TaxID=1690608 RepID=A0AAV9PPP8_9PEZI|nr:hypothetical protein LTR77_001044 [Saxophila tyrrhenica]
MADMGTIQPLPFYAEWSGHPIADLSLAHQRIRTASDKPVVFLAGDSSLDNKAWVPSDGAGGQMLPGRIPEIYNSFLSSPNPKPDVAYFLNQALEGKASVINAAVEASLLRQRDDALLPHDELIRDSIRPEDVLVVSVGANDIALSPTTATARHMLQLAWFTPKSSIENGTASSLRYFRNMFGAQLQAYIARLVAKHKPRAVIVCMIYYPLEAQASSQSSWADAQLKMLGYGWFPGQLQAAIKQIYESATMRIEVEGTNIIPCDLYKALDGKTEADYVARVEPSVEGGRKMAVLLKRELDGTFG